MGSFSTANTLSLREYDLILNKVLNRHFKVHLQDPDIIEAGLCALVEADVKFNGTGNLMGYRSSMVRRAIQWEISRKNRHEKAMDAMNCFAKEYYVMEYPCEIFEVAQKVLKEKEYQVIEMRFKQDMTYDQISLKTNMSKERVRQMINESIEFLYMLLKPEDF